MGAIGTSSFSALGVLLLTLSFAEVAGADDTLAVSPSISVAEAQRRFEEGVRAYDQKNYEAARVAFAQAYALEPLPQLLVNLGHMELRTGRYVDGARHLSQALRDADIDAAERAKAEEALKAAEQQVGGVQIALDVDGATLVIDDDKVGTSPLIYVWYVEPGEHRVRASKKGYEPADEVFGVSKGQTKKIQMNLTPMPAANAAAGSAAPSSPESPNGRAPHRPATVPLLVGGGLAAVGLGAGVIFAVLSAGDNSDRERALRSLATDSGLSNPCANGSAFASRCAHIADRDSSARHQQTASGVGFALGAAALLGTLTYWLWPRSDSPKTTATQFTLTPLGNTTGGRVQISGEF